MKLIAYDQLVHDALRQVVRNVLKQIQNKGIPGQHRLYITFQTQNCSINERLKKRYPQEMTIVLQKQFENLQVNENDFSVTLYFDNRPEHLVIPFHAMIGFNDPHASFSLRMTPNKQNNSPPPRSNPPSKPKGEVVELDAFRRRHRKA